jgi:hypothetical protein
VSWDMCTTFQVAAAACGSDLAVSLAGAGTADRPGNGGLGWMGAVLFGCALATSCSATFAVALLLVAPIGTTLLSPRADIGTGAGLIDGDHPSPQLSVVQSVDRG